MAKQICGITPTDLAGIDSYIRQLSQVNENSESFRYAASRNGEAYLHDLRRINLQRFAELMERLANYFFGFDCAFDQAYDAKGQMLAEADRSCDYGY